MLSATKNIIISILDFFHKPFAKFIPTQTFRYLACGGTNALTGLILFKVVYYNVFKDTNFHIAGPIALTPRVASLFFCFIVNNPIGFMLSSYVVFPESQIKIKTQAFRYFSSALIFLGFSYMLTKFFAFAIPALVPEWANFFVIAITTILSYLTQKFFTFKIEKNDDEENDGISVEAVDIATEEFVEQ